jgi:hypothetical protein
MTIRAVIFDIGGVLLLEADEGLETKWERRLGLKEGEFIERLVTSGVIGSANTGAIAEEVLWRQLGTTYQLDYEPPKGDGSYGMGKQYRSTKRMRVRHSMFPGYILDNGVIATSI